MAYVCQLWCKRLTGSFLQLVSHQHGVLSPGLHRCVEECVYYANC